MKDIISASYNYDKKSRPHSSFSQEVLEKIDKFLTENENENVKLEESPSRSNSLCHVCWHRNSSISIKDFKTVYMV